MCVRDLNDSELFSASKSDLLLPTETALLLCLVKLALAATTTHKGAT